MVEHLVACMIYEVIRAVISANCTRGVTNKDTITDGGLNLYNKRFSLTYCETSCILYLSSTLNLQEIQENLS